MPRSRKIEPFYLVIIDEDNHIFNVVGPLTSDRDWNREIIELKDTGRNVRCYSSPASQSRESLISRISSGGKHRFSEKLIVEEPEDTLAVYAGKLPAYAKSANRRRVVRILCRGRCGGKSRWAEMNDDYPGNDELKNSQAYFTARCLKCGYVARDPYNWYK